MGGLRTRYPCAKCLRQRRCEWLLADLRRAIADAQARGMPAHELPEVYVDCEGRFSPASRVVRTASWRRASGIVGSRLGRPVPGTPHRPPCPVGDGRDVWT